MQALPCVFVLPQPASNNVSLLRKTTCQTHPCVKQGVEARERKRDKKGREVVHWCVLFSFFFSSLKLLTTNAEIMKHVRTWNVVSARGRRWDGGTRRGGDEERWGMPSTVTVRCRTGVFPDQHATINLLPSLSALHLFLFLSVNPIYHCLSQTLVFSHPVPFSSRSLSRTFTASLLWLADLPAGA